LILMVRSAPLRASRTMKARLSSFETRPKRAAPPAITAKPLR
jgi:hypothetical protein